MKTLHVVGVHSHIFETTYLIYVCLTISKDQESYIFLVRMINNYCNDKQLLFSHPWLVIVKQTYPLLLISTGFLKYPLELKKKIQLELKKNSVSL